MKFHRSAAVLASAVILSAGAVVTVNAVTATNPIKLCANPKSGAITAPSSSGTCAKGTNDFMVASAADVQALASRMDAAESQLLTLDGTLNQARSELTSQRERIGRVEARLDQTVVMGKVLGAQCCSDRTPWGAPSGHSVAVDYLSPGTVTMKLPPGTWQVSDFTATRTQGIAEVGLATLRYPDGIFEEPHIFGCEIPDSATSCSSGGRTATIQGGREFAFHFNQGSAPSDVTFSYTLVLLPHSQNPL